MRAAALCLAIPPIEASYSLKDKVYEALKRSLVAMNLYDGASEPRLDERQLARDFGVSRTPIREAIARLEEEGLVRIVPRRGVFVVRKSKREIVEIITVWAALEGMAARLVTQRASDDEIARLRRMFATYQDGQVAAHIDEYAETNIQFHQALFRISHCSLLTEMTEKLLPHVRAIRQRTIADDGRAQRSIIDHMRIIEALEARATELAERLAREHALNLAAHVERNVDYLD